MKEKNRITASVSIEGTKSLLFHGAGKDSISLVDQEKTGVSGRDPQEWKRTVHADKEGKLYIPSTYLFSCLKSAAKGVKKKGRSNYSSDLVSTLQFEEEQIFFPNRKLPSNWKNLEEGEIPECSTDSKDYFYLDIRPVKNPSSRGLNIRYRLGVVKGWQLQFVMNWDKTVLPTDVMRSVAEKAGALYGIGDGRTVGLGRFKVVRFNLNEAA